MIKICSGYILYQVISKVSV